MSLLEKSFELARAENRALLIGYLPAGFPTLDRSILAIKAMAEGGVDVIEVGLPYSDPVMDGPVIQQASEMALANGFKTRDVFKVVAASPAPTLVMSYWNPIERFGVAEFSENLKKAGGEGVITPDLTIEESQSWISSTDKEQLHRVYVVAPSTTDNRLAKVTKHCSGFIYAASLMGVTGARRDVSSAAQSLVERVKKVSNTPVCVGLGVSTGEQAREISKYADGVIVGSAFIKLILDSKSESEANLKVKSLATELAAAVRR
ncbi:MAG: tryptophan synthase subunit alpha [Candidatus Nanopelagicaceae bacterium]|nr:tryptophan synthase subunit alpha [Candidatus Nanopelagicaceae bacterium]